MKKSVLFLFAGAFALNALAATNITTPTVSGNWTVSGSPYKVFNNIIVNTGSYLYIAPGVEVIFQGDYRLTVAGGMRAVGTAAQPILFHVQDTTGWYNPATTNGGWGGIFFDTYYGVYHGYAPDSSTFEYCRVYDMKSDDGFALFYRAMHIKNCEFFHNNKRTIAVNLNSVLTFEMSNCKIYNNRNNSNMIVSVLEGTTNIHDCELFNNVASTNCISIFNGTVIFKNNKLYKNRQTGITPGSALMFNGCTALIEKNTVYENVATMNGPIALWDSRGDVVGNYVCNNQSTAIDDGSGTCGSVQGGGGIRLQSSTAPAGYSYTLRNNIVANNDAAFGGGGIYIMDEEAYLYNNLIINNTGYFGGGVYMSNAFGKPAAFKNNIFYNNVSYHGGADTADLFIPMAANFGFDHNWCRSTFSRNLGTSPAFTGTLTSDTATNVIGALPGIKAPTNTPGCSVLANSADFRLKPGSACIDAGDTTGTMTPATDYYGNARFFGSKVDIGACEFDPALITAIVPSNDKKQPGLSVYPNPAVDYVFIELPMAKGTVSLVDISGRIIVQKSVTNKITDILVHGLPSGVYQCIWNHSSETLSGKIVIE
jgi:hypothetical protein